MKAAPMIRPSLAILVLCSAVQPFALNVLAPATPAIARSLGTDYGTIQLTLTLYLAAVALSQLVVGPLSDRIGRRPCIIGGLGLFTLGSILGYASDSLVTLLLARMLQAAGAGTAFALTRAIARDMAGKDEAASIIGYVTMAMVVAPMLAPLVGGFVEKNHGWRLIFALMALVGLIATTGAMLKLPETMRRTGAPARVLDMFRAFPRLMRERAFLVASAILTLTSATFFSFIAGAPYAVVEHMKAGPDVYGFFFVMMAGSYMLGNFLTGRFGQRIGAARMIPLGLAISAVSVGIASALPFIMVWQPALLFVPLMLNGIGNGLTIPSATASALSVRPELAGAAAGLTGFVQLGIGAGAAYLAGALTPIWPPAFLMLMLGCTLGAAAIRFLDRRS
ncbi:MAG: multidrug effflux MFS transporter [Bosea sp.]|jgi:DHA1 family bicyclomycin/chloramphenicol resistance-like MFS transporter|nr:multidrug effflux MFS transporter [Bosea sp. (in: a-proteobacteria)]